MGWYGSIPQRMGQGITIMDQRARYAGCVDPGCLAVSADERPSPRVSMSPKPRLAGFIRLSYNINSQRG